MPELRLPVQPLLPMHYDAVFHYIITHSLFHMTPCLTQRMDWMVLT